MHELGGFGSSPLSHWSKNNIHQPASSFKTTITKTWMDMNESVFFFFISFLLKIKLSCCGKWTNEDDISKPIMNDRKSNCIKSWLWKTRTQAKLPFYAFKFTMQVMGIPATIVHNRPLTSNSSHADHGTNGFETSSPMVIGKIFFICGGAPCRLWEMNLENQNWCQNDWKFSSCREFSHLTSQLKYPISLVVEFGLLVSHLQVPYTNYK